MRPGRPPAFGTALAFLACLGIGDGDQGDRGDGAGGGLPLRPDLCRRDVPGGRARARPDAPRPRRHLAPPGRADGARGQPGRLDRIRQRRAVVGVCRDPVPGGRAIPAPGDLAASPRLRLRRFVDPPGGRDLALRRPGPAAARGDGLGAPAAAGPGLPRLLVLPHPGPDLEHRAGLRADDRGASPLPAARGPGGARGAWAGRRNPAPGPPARLGDPRRLPAAGRGGRHPDLLAQRHLPERRGALGGHGGQAAALFPGV